MAMSITPSSIAEVGTKTEVFAPVSAEGTALSMDRPTETLLVAGLSNRCDLHTQAYRLETVFAHEVRSTTAVWIYLAPQKW